MKDSLSVNEFSKLSGIEKTTLRYWDEIGLFSPAWRDPENNYRYYIPQQIIAVNFVTVLSELNVPLKAISAMKDKRTPESIVELIDRQEVRLDAEMRKLLERYAIIHARRGYIQYGLKMADIAHGECKVTVYDAPERNLILGPPNAFVEGESFYGAFMRFCRQAKGLRINLSYPIGGYHETMEGFLAAPHQPDRFFSVDPTGNHTKFAGEYLSGFVRGYYGEFGDLPQQMAAYMADSALTATGPVYAVYLHDEICITDPSQYLSMITVAVTKRRL